MKFNLGKPKKSKERLFKKDMKSPTSFAKCKRDKDGFTYIDVNNSPFVLGGLIKPEDNGNEYYRLDVTRKEEYSGANRSLANHTAGGCIRFRPMRA